MTNKGKKSFTVEFKTKVAIAAIKANKTQNQLSSLFGVHGRQIYAWKKQAVEAIKNCFSQRKSSRDKEKDELIAELYQQIGQQKVELDWLKKKSGIYC